ncbi:adenylate/guanylate cyclase domain-containing protein [Mesorhizobium onobrychidis]|uniref:Adenylate/guanylate cyclase domain-containing protein n=1 Tax=Mesorhizobium onobrychidis TaxID=2775404 RepID=A0ABY5R5I6_9HYPH|nr:adenylate/guanylate cyclase domain-containing protein [Mesorhizobium onobrychidis]UVC18454.1 adenylate/guanylate cyclase domain-containing protein [Mesorhizobium onobrychidis]
MQRPETRYARSGDIAIAYQVVGDGPIDLLYAPGWLTNVEYTWESPEYTRFLKKLARFSRLILFDKRGMGMSDRDVGFPTLDQRTEDIKAVLDAVGSSGAALFGVSEGGNMASLFAATHPEWVSALILYGSHARSKWAEDYPLGRWTEDDIERYVGSLLENWGRPFDLDAGAPSVAGDPVVQNWFAAYLRFSASPRAAELITRLGFEIDIRAILPAIKVPTLVLHRAGDRWHAPEEARYLAERIPDAKLRILPGEDHLPWYGDLDRLVGEIEEFLTGTRTSANYDRALITVLMTDIVDSTVTLSAMGDERWHAILEQLDINVSRHVAAFRGRKVKHTGDGYMLAFSGPTAAIECAQRLARDADALGLKLRTGIHTGECERRGDDLSGLAVHLAARIMAESAPGAISTSRTVKDLAVGSGVSFTFAGHRKMKGIPESWEVYTLSG